MTQAAAGLPGIIGHARPQKVLLRAIATGRAAHAYLFWGPDGIGKERVARGLAQVLLCHDPEARRAGRGCGACAACRKGATGAHPDLHLIGHEEKTITVERVRELQSALAYQAFERGGKVAIIPDAHRMSREAANALLKTLEEPPDGATLFLLAHHRSQLLDTIVSRCQSIRFDALTEGETLQVLAAHGVAPDRAQELARFAGGSPGMALALDGDAIAGLEEEIADLAMDWPKLTALERMALSERWSKDRDELALRLSSLERQLARRAVEHEWALTLVERIGRVRGWLDRNANPQLALDFLFLGDDGAWKRIGNL